MGAVKYLTGQKFGRLTVIDREGSDKHKNATWNCVCDCGNEKIVTSISLKSGNTKSCGCIFKEQIIARNKCMQKSIEERLEINIDKSSGRWIWKGCKDKDGYGIISYKGRMDRAHRVIYKLYIGEIPEGICVCHKNDTPWDVTPSNLWLGTLADNNRDRANKGRSSDIRGEKCCSSKLKDSDVLEIRKLYSTGLYKHRELQKMFNISLSQIGSITRRETWNHV